MERRLDPRSAQQCRDQAERLRGLAAKARSPAVQRDYRELAYEWDIMWQRRSKCSAASAECRPGSPDPTAPLDRNDGSPFAPNPRHRTRPYRKEIAYFSTPHTLTFRRTWVVPSSK